MLAKVKVIRVNSSMLLSRRRCLLQLLAVLLLRFRLGRFRWILEVHDQLLLLLVGQVGLLNVLAKVWYLWSMVVGKTVCLVRNYSSSRSPVVECTARDLILTSSCTLGLLLFFRELLLTAIMGVVDFAGGLQLLVLFFFLHNKSVFFSG